MEGSISDVEFEAYAVAALEGHSETQESTVCVPLLTATELSIGHSDGAFCVIFGSDTLSLSWALCMGHSTKIEINSLTGGAAARKNSSFGY